MMCADCKWPGPQSRFRLKGRENLTLASIFLDPEEWIQVAQVFLKKHMEIAKAWISAVQTHDKKQPVLVKGNLVFL